jgi:hypothetical protein
MKSNNAPVIDDVDIISPIRVVENPFSERIMGVK